MVYLRFGEIPRDGKSVNFFKLTYDEMDRLSYHQYPDKAKEPGISVFEMDDNGLPKLYSLQSCSSLAERLYQNIYEVEGDVIGSGADGEPLLKNVNIIKKRLIPAEKLIQHISETLMKNFQVSEKNDTPPETHIHHFHMERKMDLRTGEIVSLFVNFGDSKNYKPMPPVDEYTFNGYTYCDPIETFDCYLGMRESHYFTEQVNVRTNPESVMEQKPAAGSKLTAVPKGPKL